MKKLFLAALLIGSVIRTDAMPILVGEWNSKNSGEFKELAAAEAAITAYNLIVTNPDLPLLGTPIKIQDEPNIYFGSDDKSILWTAPSDASFYYVLTKWGQGNDKVKTKGGAAKDSKDDLPDTALHYLLAGDILKYNPGGNDLIKGLSHVSIWSGPKAPGQPQPVPDGGNAMVLLGIAMVGIELFRRKALR